jgi:hypothetical protein
VQGLTLSECFLKSRLAGDDTANKKSGQSAVVSHISTNLANQFVTPGQSANVSQMATNSESEAGSVQPKKIVNNVSNKKIITNNIVLSEQSTNVHDSTTVNTFTSKKKLAQTTETVTENSSVTSTGTLIQEKNIVSAVLSHALDVWQSSRPLPPKSLPQSGLLGSLNSSSAPTFNQILN